MNLIHAWEMHHQEQHVPDHQVQTTLSGISAASPPDFNASEFESFQYLPTIDGSSIHVEKQESVWAQEWSRHEQETAESDDEDEFREEWSNDHFTQAYINSHQSQFRAIEEQDCLKEARLEEERERLRQASGGPPRSAWLMAGVTTISEQKTAGGETGSTLQPPRRLPVPRLDPLKQEIAQEHQHSMFSIDEFMSFDYHHDYNQPQTTLQPSLRPSNPVQAKDRFMTLVSDLHLAEQTFYPGATSATSNEMDDTAAFTSTMHPQIQTGWSQEFEGNNQVKHRGAEWNWEKTFGKDPRRQMKATEAHLVISREKNGDLDESERLKAVALTRLQALFGHLSFTPPTS
ncbi:hypothetical protein BX616_000046 [Lobosporangium transversale]|uniref:Uncharacterized protein n=1 Tax=Lobosporangium transversale TaxID=64571 RepID=A0A1Y2G9Y2_9FUNG|nr:hypothetical protein BCR41DRAFT_362035 [Lobosporangium transversale]KAF9919193.1 hypothetical protein BX616_000046 [Lobosporangium transversale]ORZ05164.1 hypothetical protein BCR41DRAFT_362035 [Lobosporangium transversale]|eukprot:XP_021876939.1 hypothetical protein BCR41DRAFT_362035 [Lobosporangium transversale]